MRALRCQLRHFQVSATRAKGSSTLSASLDSHAVDEVGVRGLAYRRRRLRRGEDREVDPPERIAVIGKFSGVSEKGLTVLAESAG